MDSQAELFPDDTPPEVDEVVRETVDKYGFDATEAALGRIKIQMSGPLPSAPGRAADPPTSQGRRMADVRRFRRETYSGRLLTYVGKMGSVTDREAAAGVVGLDADPAKFEGCRRRMSDLRAAGYLDDTGLESGGRIVWTITPQGRIALRRLQETGWSR